MRPLVWGTYAGALTTNPLDTSLPLGNPVPDLRNFQFNENRLVGWQDALVKDLEMVGKKRIWH
jgi:hypothetical protein